MRAWHGSWAYCRLQPHSVLEVHNSVKVNSIFMLKTCLGDLGKCSYLVLDNPMVDFRFKKPTTFQVPIPSRCNPNPGPTIPVMQFDP